MNSGTKAANVRYIATIRNVREVILMGASDLSLWSKVSAPPDLYPLVSNDRLQLIISATDARWLGYRIQELTISIPVNLREGGSSHVGNYLFKAYNSSSLFSAIERRSFHTPYQKGMIEVTTIPSPSIKLTRDNVDLIDFRMGSVRTAASEGEEAWEGPIFLPAKESSSNGEKLLFYAYLGGFTGTYPFVDETDRVKLNPVAEDDHYQLLLDSNFNGTEWRIREKATHSRSRTLKR